MLGANKLTTLALAAFLGSALTISLTPAYAQKHSGGGGSSHSSSDADHADGGHSGKGGKGGQGMGQRGGSGGQSLRDVFQSIDSGATSDHSSASGESDAHGSKGGAATTSRGKKGSASTATKGSSTKGSATAGKKGGKSNIKAAEEEDSDRPAWAGTSGRDGKPGRGNVASGTKKGDIFGDMYVLLRDENGVPILKEITLADGTKIYVVQPVDADGNPLPLDAEGNLINPDLATAVDLGRLNVGRSPRTVLSSQYEEVLKSTSTWPIR